MREKGINMNTGSDPIGPLINNVVSNGGKTLEKVALYVVGILSTAGVIDPSGINKNTIPLVIGAILTGLHISTPTPKSGPNQL